ncbi:MAG: hypothetical protein K0Q60_3483 [Microvirga sp.]|nr:hypothetical protein [Microvirga sp.]
MAEWTSPARNVADLSPLSITIERDPRGGYFVTILEADGETMTTLELTKEKGCEIAARLVAGAK